MMDIYGYLLFVYMAIFIYQDAIKANVDSAGKDLDISMSKQCAISSATTTVTIIEGINGSKNFCSIIFTRDVGNLTLVQIQGGYARETDYIYVKHKDEDSFPSRYIGFMNSDTASGCCLSFEARVLTFYLHGNISLHLETTMTNKPHLKYCPSTKSNPNLQNISSCAKIVEYSNVIECYHRTRPPAENVWPYETRCDIQCPSDCLCTLGNRLVEYLCSDQKTALIAYPANISHLNFSHNNLSSVSSSAFQSISEGLEHLDLGYNFIMSISTSFNHLPNLKILKLKSNEITKLDRTCFQYLIELLELDLSENFIETLQNDVFAELKSLTYLDLTDSKLQTIDEQTFSSLGNLESLVLEINEITFFYNDTFKGLYNLTLLNIRVNSLDMIQQELFRDLHMLQILHLEHNFLTTLTSDVFNSLGALKKLMVNHNCLQSLDDETFHYMRDIDTLILAKNELMILKATWFEGLHNLLQLELWGNYIKILEPNVFSNLHSILGVHLQGNQIEVLDKAAMTGLATVKELDIYNNSLNTVEPGVFDHMVMLHTLILAKNKLTYLPLDIFKHTIQLQYLDLSMNQLQNLPLLGHLFKLTHLIIKENALTKVDKAGASKIFYQFPETVKLIVTQQEICSCLLNESYNCIASDLESPYLTCERMLPDMVLIVFMWVGGFGALFGNALVLFWRKTQPQEEYQVQKILIGNLALADLFMGLYMIIIASADVHYGDYFPMNAQNWRSSAVCRLAGALAITSSEASIMLLTVISVDRLIHIKYQMYKWKPRLSSTKWTVLSVWLFALIIALGASILAEGKPDVYEASNVCVGLPLAMKKVHTTNMTDVNIIPNSFILQSASYEYWLPNVEAITEVDDTAPGMYLSISIFLGLNFLCCVIIVGCYICIVITVFRSVSQIRRQRHMRHEMRMTVKVVAIIATDLCCWCPIILTSILVQADITTISPRTFVWIVTFILPINSVINPYLYTLGNVIADRMPRSTDRSGSASRNTYTTNAERQSRPEPTNHHSQYATENDENDYKAPLVEKPFVLMETCV